MTRLVKEQTQILDNFGSEVERADEPHWNI